MPALSNPRQEAFCQAYARGEHSGNGRASYKVAYGRDDTAAASRLQRRDSVSQRIAEIRAEVTAQEAEATRQATEKLGISKEWVLQKLVANVERASQVEAVIGSDGEPIGEYKYDGSVVNKALELLGKHVGMFTQPVEPQGLNVKVGIELVDRPPRETFKQWEDRRARELAERGRLNTTKGKAK